MSISDLAPKANPNPPWNAEVSLLAEMRANTAQLERIAAAVEALAGVRRPPTSVVPWGGNVPELNDLNLGGKP